VPLVPTGSTLLATLRDTTPSYSAPGGPSNALVPASWHGAPTILPVIESRQGYVEVRLAQRPNESTTWLKASSVTFTTTPFRIVVNLAKTHLYVYDHNRQVLAAPAGVGTALAPTPTGRYFVAFFAQPPDPGYGPFVMVTSAHSNAITDWDDSGDAMVAIHGPLGEGARIGTTGAALSHGCIRLQLADQILLRIVPAGSPIDIVAS